MDELRPNLGTIFLTFGLGALFCALVAFFQIDWKQFDSFPNYELPLFNDAVWPVISIVFIFLMHAIGKLAIGLGVMLDNLISLKPIDRICIFVRLLKADNARLWLRFEQIESNRQFILGILGISEILLILTSLEWIGYIFDQSSATLPDFSPLYFSLAIGTASFLWAKLVLIEMNELLDRHEHRKES